MAKKRIPVYDICTLHNRGTLQTDLLIERFSSYLGRHYDHLHFPHRHSFYHFVLFTKGSGRHSIDFNQFAVKSGQVYFMAPGQVHSWNFDSNVDGYIVNFSESFFKAFLLDPNYFDRFDFFNGLTEQNVKQLTPSEHNLMVETLEQLVAIKHQNDELNTDLIRILLLRLFIAVQQMQTRNKKKAAPHHRFILLRHFRQLIEKYYRSLKLPKEYADLLYITPNHLNALCQDLQGKSAGEIIRERVLLEAKRLLINADMSIAEVAYDLNFQDNSYFTRFFRKHTGITPEDFRKQYIIS